MKMRRFDNETDDDLRPWLEAAAQAYCYEPNTSKELDSELCVTAAILMLREYRRQVPKE